MPATTTPNSWANSFGCGFCGLSFQCIEPVLDSEGNPVYNEDGDRALIVNNDEQCSEEINYHMDSWHPELDEVDEYGNKRREHTGKLPPGF